MAVAMRADLRRMEGQQSANQGDHRISKGLAVWITSLVLGAASWIAVVFSAAYAMANHRTPAIFALAVAGTTALLGLALSVFAFPQGLARSRLRGAALQAGSWLGMLVSGSAGLVALVFAVSIHW